MDVANILFNQMFRIGSFEGNEVLASSVIEGSSGKLFNGEAADDKDDLDDSVSRLTLFFGGKSISVVSCLLKVFGMAFRKLMLCRFFVSTLFGEMLTI